VTAWTEEAGCVACGRCHETVTRYWRHRAIGARCLRCGPHERSHAADAEGATLRERCAGLALGYAPCAVRGGA
jgi:hypothetical protein